MFAKSLLNPILRDEAITRGLSDPEARILIEWLVEHVETVHADARAEIDANQSVLDLCQRARTISRFVRLWCHENAHGAACQFAATQRFAWPLPTTTLDPCELMQKILSFEISSR